MAERPDAELAKLDPDELWTQLGSRLLALPPDAYLRCLAYFMAEYRRLYHEDGLPEAYDRIVDGIVAMTAEAAAGGQPQDAAKLLDREFTELTYPGLEDGDAVQPYAGPLALELFKACGDALWELTDEAHRYDSAESIADGAADYDDPRDRLANIRVLLRFLDRVAREAEGKAPTDPDNARNDRAAANRSLDERRAVAGTLITAVAGPLTVCRAGPADLRSVLELLDTTATWLHNQGVPDWLTWPDIRDTIASSIGRGEVWLLRTAAGDVAATATLSTGDPGPGLWNEDDREVAATYLSRLAVRPDLHDQGVGAKLLDWACVHAYRHGSFFLRFVAWPRMPRLHAYLRRHGFRELWTVAGPPATSRTLFLRHAAPNDTVVRITEEPPPVLLPTQSVEVNADDVRPAQGSGPDHAHVAHQLVSEHGRPIRLVPGYRYRLRDTDEGWRLQGAKYVGWQAGDRITMADGLTLEHDCDYVLIHHDGYPCGVEIVSIQRQRT
ncbi:GNAT family N-acetyltransferase [Dactylosporangium sp. NPDC005572]|uniref:GNAT family N-acetyltransferase n=1 Tax=Dactylosporangium sp. NPDC005572 TaxID=3156889 RepID=UPI0033AAA1F3